MDSLSPIEIISTSTCRVKTPNGKGTGVLFKVDHSDQSYLLTAKHCLLGASLSEALDINDVQLTTFDHSTLSLNETCEIYYPDDLDIALIKLYAQPEIPALGLQLINTHYFNGKCSFKGYPKAYNNIEQIGLNAEYSENNILTVNTPLSTFESDPLYNVKGFSGSGVFCHDGENVYLSGIVTKYLGTFQRFRVVDLSFLKNVEHLEKVNTDIFSSLPENKAIQKDLEKITAKSERNLDSIKSLLANKYHVERDEIKKEFKGKIQKFDAVVITGKAGVGKSAFAKSILKDLSADQKYNPIVFKAEEFAVSSLDIVFDYLENNLEAVLKEVGREQQLVILIDSAEKLIEVENYHALKEFIGVVKKLKGVKLIISCRTYAYQQLLYDLHNYLPAYRSIEVKRFSKEELKNVATVFPKIEPLINESRLSKILSRAFYLNLAASHAEQFLEGGNLTEPEFKRIIWDEIISKRSQERAAIFEKIAVDRAISMKQFINVEDVDQSILEDLKKDEIIEAEEQLQESYRATHDIYEDIALVRHIERVFQRKRSKIEFFETLGGKQPAIRRAFRLWLIECLEINPERLSVLIEEVINNEELGSFWKDEVLVSILRSNYSERFLRDYNKTVSENSFQLLLELMQLLRTACQVPNEELSRMVAEADIVDGEASAFLKPDGFGWTVIIEYIRDNIDSLSGHVKVILDLIIKDWSNKLSWSEPLPREAEAVRDILVHYINCLKKSVSEETDFRLSDKHLEGMVKLLVRITKVSKQPLAELINESLSYQPKRFEERQLRSLYDEITKVCLSGINCRSVCQELPDLVIRMAKKNWLITESEEEIWGSTFDIETDFGITSAHEFSYFPANMYKTPVRFLLWFHPWKALNFIVELINHATNSYAESERGKRSNIKEVTITSLQGVESKQLGNEVIWGMYRGFVESVPYLITSVLMALEEWLLGLCDPQSKIPNKELTKIFEYLLTNSESVALTAVLASVSISNPEKIGRSALPIIRVKEFYDWDRRRLIGDKSPLAPWDRELPFAQKHVHQFNELPHRKRHLEQLVSMLQVYGYSEEVNKILDNFMEGSEGDPNWQLVISRMDFRNFRVDESIELPEENKVALTAQIDPKLKETIDNQEETKELLIGNQMMSITNWALMALEGKINDPTYEEWKEKFETYNEIMTSNSQSVWPFGDPLNIAICALKLFRDKISKDEFLWSLEVIIEVLKFKILRHLNGDYMSPIGALSNHLNVFVPQILKLDLTEGQKKETKELIFLALIHFQNHEREQVIEAFRNELWDIDSAFAQSCVNGLLEYSQKYREIIIRRRTGNQSNYSIEKLKKEYSGLVEDVVEENIDANLQQYEITVHSLYYLIHATQLIPYSTDKQKHIDCYIYVFEAIVTECLIKEEGISHGNIYTEKNHYRRALSNLILLTDEKYGHQIFDRILDYLFEERQKWERKLEEFLDNTLEDIIHAQTEINSSQFWKFWEKLEKKLRTKKEERILKHLFLSSRWWPSNQQDWEPLAGKKLYYKQLTNEFGVYAFDSVLKLLSGIGTAKLLPDGINWIKQIFESKADLKSFTEESDRFYYLEKLIEAANKMYQTQIKNDQDLRVSFLFILDLLIENGSSKAYNIRERFISVG
ncbi:MAG: NACHT domain-containing protein [Gracilimonas sp.]|uniref:NACHT domain-containing protein n=1 Tax=Gracilimonas sp. TaxID=1974203 RepID=UPI001B0FD966|nr:NACHT domain-containing protein [Gracilimonas sp.]MBO6585324.1 NACHT domain-containing protein [Gracilimonas sp.]MBO6616320.1 NACHT domain-containing protein [Gracilimonas sp.]